MATPIDQIAAALRNAIGQGLDDAAGVFDKAATDASGALGPALSGVFGGGFSIDDILLLIPGVGELLTAPGSPIAALFAKAGEFVLGIGSGWALGEFFSEALRPVWLEVTHAINAELTSEIFDPETAAMLAARGIISVDFANSEAGGGNLDSTHEGFLIEAAKARPGLPELVNLLNRDALTEDEVTTNLQRAGYDAPTITALLTLRRNLLSPADLALANLRGDLDDTDMQAYADQLGVDSDDMNLLTLNTGEPPGPEELMEALRRGFIDTATFEHGIRQSRVRDEWIPTLEQLQYSPMGVADAVRAVVENYITSDQGAAIAEQNGLEADHWPVLVESWGRPLAHEEMGDLVYRGLASRDQFDQAMRESDIKDTYIDLAFDITERLPSPYDIIRAVRYNAISLTDGATLLLQQGYSQDNASMLLKIGLNMASGTSHELTRAQITSLYEDGILSRADAMTHLTSMGYSETDANYILQLIDVAQQVKNVKAEVAATRLSYLAGGISAVDAENQMTQIGVSALQAQANVAAWDREKHRAARGLTEAQVVKAAKENTITYDNAVNLLTALGYSSADANTLLNSNGVSATAPTPPATATVA